MVYPLSGIESIMSHPSRSLFGRMRSRRVKVVRQS
jgi:hypothetical protein